MDETILWIIAGLLGIIILNQTQERQARETEGMTKKQKEKYFEDAKQKQKANSKSVWWILGWMIVWIIVFIICGLIGAGMAFYFYS